MSDTAATLRIPEEHHPLAQGSSRLTNVLLVAVILVGAGWAATQLIDDLEVVHDGKVVEEVMEPGSGHA